ncbi:3-phosphoshikimate 1-carboxyvinyltransferase [uncultured Winogradskyella sp.]|uniref:3-phosphoshikimate 1-carboxyvinyltransferase n=1 Tax=uncultured Winogradskyella sp. TaxID=395353 RepID=UPI0035155A2B
MLLSLQKSKLVSGKTLQITGSKSESNRLLLLQALFPEIKILNLSNSDDTVLMKEALSSEAEVVDIHHAGTAMRFLTAFFAVKPKREVVLTGSQRMKERPIGILVEALQTLGADISYLEKQGYPPLKIRGRNINKSQVRLKANVSSQYISALLLIAPVLKRGLTIELEGTVTSVPYINMTLSLLNQLGIETSFNGQFIKVYPFNKTLSAEKVIEVESDWSSASYFYSFIALSDVGTEIILKSYKSNSLQGDAILAKLYREFGVETVFEGTAIRLKKSDTVEEESSLEIDLSNAPDIAQTIAVTAFGLQKPIHLTGLHTLKIKETDRLVALKNELTKLGAQIEITANSLELKATQSIKPNVAIATYNDHRMAMAFAPLALRTSIVIEDADVVSKSYPSFWDDLQSIGIILK